MSIWRGTVVFEGTRYGTLFDDAMISMCCARNLAAGNGLVWKAGEPGVVMTLREGLPPDTSIAVVWAGSLPYSSELPVIDLLGKSDPIIAHGASDESAFLPGHSKWDYRYRVGELLPDVVLGVRSSEAPLLGELGYRSLTPRVWVSPTVDAETAEFISTVVARAEGPLG